MKTKRFTLLSVILCRYAVLFSQRSIGNGVFTGLLNVADNKVVAFVFLNVVKVYITGDFLLTKLSKRL